MRTDEIDKICTKYAEETYSAAGIGHIKKILFRAISEALSAEYRFDGDSWVKWYSSEEGKQCRQGTTSGEYLENRLWRAFMAGTKNRDV